MSEEHRNIMVNDIDWSVYFEYSPGQRAITHLAPEDCQEGIEPSIEITGLYLYNYSVCDLVEVVSDETIEDIETDLLENRDE